MVNKKKEVKNNNKKKEVFVSKNITITDNQAKWIKFNCVNLSWVVQSKLEELMSR